MDKWQAQKLFCTGVDTDVALAEGFGRLMMWKAMNGPLENKQRSVGWFNGVAVMVGVGQAGGSCEEGE